MEEHRTKESHAQISPLEPPENIERPSSSRQKTEDLSAACRAILDNVNDGVYMINPRGFFTYLNCTTLKRTGLSPENYRDRHYLDLIAPEDRKTVQERFENVMRGEENPHYDVIIEGKDGLIYIVEVKSRPLFENGRVVGMLGISRDVTDRRKAEEIARNSQKIMERMVEERTRDLEAKTELLRQSEEKYRTLVDNLNIGVFRSTLHPPQGYFLEANPALANIHGFDSVEEFKKRSVASLYPDAGDRKKFIEEVLKSGAVRSRELRLKKKDGTLFWGAVTGIAHRDSDGNARWIDGVVEDITERKAAEQARRDSETRYRAVFENTGTAMVIAEEDMTVSLANDEVEKLTGYSKKELYALQDWRELFPPDEVARLERYHTMRRKKPGSVPRQYETRIVERTGTVKNILVTSDLIPGTRKSVLSFIDITGRRQAEEALRQSEQYYRTIFENTGSATLIIEEDTTISLVNSTFEKTMGYSKAEIEGKKSWKVLADRTETERLMNFHAVRRTNPKDVPNSYETILLDNRGKQRDVFVTIDMVPGTKRSVASFVDITDLKETERKLKTREKELGAKARKLQEANAALKVLLKVRESDRKEIEESVLLNVRKLVLPYLEKVRERPEDPECMSYIDIAERKLHEITLPFVNLLTARHLQLTPREFQIMDLIRDGKSSKEIAVLFNISVKGIEFHRENIRSKLGLRKSKANLKTYLLSLEKKSTSSAKESS